MADSVVDIPLPGRRLDSGRESVAAPAYHFVSGPENRLVEVAVGSMLLEPDRRRASADPQQAESLLAACGFSPLVLYGPSGVGKSHIARGLATAWKARDRRQRVVATTATDFARELADAIDSQAVEEFRNKYRKADLFVLEDLGEVAMRKSEKLSAQEELVHTLDELLADERWVVVTAPMSPAELPGLLPRLRSRLTAGLVIAVSPPGPRARAAVLRQLAAVTHLALPEPVVAALAEGLSGTVLELAGALAELAGAAEAERTQVDLATARRYLSQRNRLRRPTVHEIALATARHFALRLGDLKSPVRRRALVNARGVAVYLARHLAGASLEEIGRYFGGRDHTTVLHSCRKTEERCATDPATHEAIEQLRKELWKK